MGPPHVPSGLQVDPAGQQLVQPHSVCVDEQSGTHAPPEQTSPQPQAGEHSRGRHTPESQNSPPGQAPDAHVPPHPSGPPQVPVVGHDGAQRHV